jgi:hypothetical protein
MNTNTNTNISNNFLSCDVITTLQDYMLNDKNIAISLQDSFTPIQKANCNKIESKKIIQNNSNKNNSTLNDFFIPIEKDSLFWCFYMMKNGEVKYEL